MTPEKTSELTPHVGFLVTFKALEYGGSMDGLYWSPCALNVKIISG